MRPGATIARKSYEHVRSQLKSINDFSKPFGPLLVVVNLDPTNPLLLKKDIPKERIEFQWIESIPPQVMR